MKQYPAILLITLIVTVNLCCGETSEEDFTPELCNAVCEAPDGYNCWYVSTRGSDSNPGTCEKPFSSVQHAVNSMNSGDVVYLRGGTYFESEIDVPLDRNGTCSDVECTTGNWSTVKSYPGEWARINSRHRGRYVIGRQKNSLGVFEVGRGSIDVHYWKFEKFEITGGGQTDYAGGIMINGGPFIMRYLYIHDNYFYPFEGVYENPGGIRGYNWQDSIIEFCYFDNNAVNRSDAATANAAHIHLFPDYYRDLIMQNGYPYGENPPVARNTVRYNYFNNTFVGFKHKTAQLFCGRNSAIQGYVDTYDTYGDRIHHNIFYGQTIAMHIDQDFCQIYNNIVDNAEYGIAMPSDGPQPHLYKVVTYNNLFKNISAIPFVRFKEDDPITYEITEHYGWDYNNIFDGSSDYNNYFSSVTMNIVPSWNSTTKPNTSTIYGLSNYYNDRNYFYRPAHSNLICMAFDYYTAEEFEVQTETGNNPTVYSNDYDPADELFTGETGANQYIARGDHVLEDLITVRDGGFGGPHPYLIGVTIPDYIGPVDPDRNAWPEGVFGLTQLSGEIPVNLRDAPADEPDWIE